MNDPTESPWGARFIPRLPPPETENGINPEILGERGVRRGRR